MLFEIVRRHGFVPARYFSSRPSDNAENCAVAALDHCGMDHFVSFDT